MSTARSNTPSEMSVVDRWIDRVLFTSAVVENVTDVAEGFRLIELEGPSLTKKEGLPGDKIQVRASGFSMRTYTPVGWDAERGRTRLCAYVHGAGPGARWAGSVRRGDTCSFFGPRRSLSIAKLSGDIVLFGDETSLGVGASVRSFRPEGTRLVFEATAELPMRTALGALELDDVAIVQRRTDDDHLREASEEIARSATPNSTVVLTGKAASIVRLRQRLRDARCPARILAKAYWAEGRTGLD
jgi:NADPH-dependent ferric siderophore reductase